MGHQFKFPAEFLSKFTHDPNGAFDLQLRISTLVLRAKQKKKLSQLQASLKSSVKPLQFKPVCDSFSHTTQTPDAHPALLLHL